MSKQSVQTFIIILKDDNGKVINFERFNCKRLSTCIKQITMLYKDMQKFSSVQEELLKVAKVVAHKTDYDTNENNKVWEVSIDEFMQMIA